MNTVYVSLTICDEKRIRGFYSLFTIVVIIDSKI